MYRKKYKNLTQQDTQIEFKNFPFNQFLIENESLFVRIRRRVGVAQRETALVWPSLPWGRVSCERKHAWPSLGHKMSPAEISSIDSINSFVQKYRWKVSFSKVNFELKNTIFLESILCWWVRILAFWNLILVNFQRGSIKCAFSYFVGLILSKLGAFEISSRFQVGALGGLI